MDTIRNIDDGGFEKANGGRYFRKVVLIGARGTLGSVILRYLHDHINDNDQITDGFDEVTVLARFESQDLYDDIKEKYPKLKAVVPVHYDDRQELLRVLKGQDAVICASGIGGLGNQNAIIDACVEAGVKRYITNDFANPPEHEGLPELRFALKVKNEVREYAQRRSDEEQARQLEKQQQSHLPSITGQRPPYFTWTALATGHFFDYALLKFPPAFGFDIPHRRARLVDDGHEPFSATTIADIAHALVVGVLHPHRSAPATQTANRHLVIRTLETTGAKLLSALQQITASEWHVEHATSAELYARAREIIAQARAKDTSRVTGDSNDEKPDINISTPTSVVPPREAMFNLLAVQIFERGAGRSSLPTQRYYNTSLGLKERHVVDVVRDILDNHPGF